MPSILSPPLSSTPSGRSSFSSGCSFATPLPAAAMVLKPHDLYTPAPSPPTSFRCHQQTALQPIPIAPAPPSPPRLQPISSLAAFTAEMISWIWFATSPAPGTDEGVPVKASKRQVVPNDNFVRFCHDVLATTQVSHSVVILALLYIYRLKANNTICGATGSEFRLTTTALMMANKILDDNTYTAKTWAEVSSLELKPLVAGEAEFLRGLDFQLHVTERDFDAWLKLLDGHLSARDAQLGHRKSSRRVGTRCGATVCSGKGGIELLGLGLGTRAGLPVEERARGTVQEEREVEQRRTLVARAPTRAPSSTSNQRPPPLRSTFSFPQSQLTSSSPYTAFSCPLPSNSNPSHPQRLIRHAHTPSYPPPTFSHSHSHSSTSLAGMYQQPSPPTTVTTRTKRISSAAFSPSSTPPLESHRDAKRLASTHLSRSISAGCSPAPRQLLYAFPEPTRRTQVPRPAPAASGTFSHLAGAFEPRYLSTLSRPESLEYFSLAAGHRQGFSHTQIVHRPASLSPLHAPYSPVDYSPVDYRTPRSVSNYANAGAPGVLWNVPPTQVRARNSAEWQEGVGWGYTP